MWRQLAALKRYLKSKVKIRWKLFINWSTNAKYKEKTSKIRKEFWARRLANTTKR